VTAAPEGVGPPVVKVPDAGRTLEFPGFLLGEVSTQIRDNPRWLEISLYKVTDGTGRYVLHLCGASVVYHRHNGSCNTGVPTPPERMPLDAEPCKVCQPPRVLDGEDDLFTWGLNSDSRLWDLEQDRYTTYTCRTAEAVVEQLRKPRNRKNSEDGTLSAPAQRLLDLVSAVDENFARSRESVQRI
jgi:hypothetical protein